MGFDKRFGRKEKDDVAAAQKAAEEKAAQERNEVKHASENSGYLDNVPLLEREGVKELLNTIPEDRVAEAAYWDPHWWRHM